MRPECGVAIPGRRRCVRAAALWAIAAALWMPATGKAAEQPSEYDVKAVFLLNFVKFVEWPAGAFADPDSPIAICILGNNPFGSVLDDLVQGETVSGRKVVVRKLSEPPSPKACQLAFAQGSAKEAAKALGTLGRGVLTVGEGESFARDGGIIGFVLENRRVRFEINRTAAETAGLTLSSKLLSVAKAVYR
jgi:YfiR/HmsC-like